MGPLGHSWLAGLETPYLWKPSELFPSRGRDNLLLHLQDKDRQSRDNNKHLTFNNFVINLLLAYELFSTSNDTVAAATKLDDLEMELFKMDIISNCSFYLQVRRAQWHTMLASRAVLLALSGRLVDSRQVVGDNFDPVSVFNSVEKSAILGIKSRAYLEYGRLAWPEALRLAKEAILINPTEAEWHFLAGKALGKLIENKGNVSAEMLREEIRYFKRAVALGKREDHMVHLANTYDRLASQIRLENYKTKLTDPLVSNLTWLSFDLFRKTIIHAGNNTKIRLCCLKGLLRHPERRFVKENLRVLMEELINEPKKIKMFFNVAGNYYLTLEKDDMKALEYFDRGSEIGDFGCSVNGLRVRHELGLVSDVERALRLLVGKYKDHPRYRDTAMCHLGAWLLLGKRDITAALHVFIPLLKHNPMCRSLRVHRPIFVGCQRPFNLLQAIYDEMSSAPLESVDPQQRREFLQLLGGLEAHEEFINYGRLDYTQLENVLYE